MPGACGGEENLSNPLGPELQMAGSCHVGAGSWAQILWDSKCSLLSHLSSALQLFSDGSHSVSPLFLPQVNSLMSSLCSELALYLCMYKCECAYNSHVHVWLRMRARVILCACVRVWESTHCVCNCACVRGLRMWSRMRVCMIAHACKCDRACVHVQMSIQWGKLIWRPQVNAECSDFSPPFFGFFLFFWLRSCIEPRTHHLPGSLVSRLWGSTCLHFPRAEATGKHCLIWLLRTWALGTEPSHIPVIYFCRRNEMRSDLTFQSYPVLT